LLCHASYKLNVFCPPHDYTPLYTNTTSFIHRKPRRSSSFSKYNVLRLYYLDTYRVFFLFQAISCLKRAIYLHPFNWIALYNLGLVHLYTRQYVSAFVFLSTSVKLNPNHAGTFMLIGCKSIFDLKLKVNSIIFYLSRNIIISICLVFTNIFHNYYLGRYSMDSIETI
jgi:tetratricopeptide (TPR) repeat protein